MRPPHRLAHNRTFTLESLPTLSSRGSLQRIQRFDGVERSSRAWDGLRKDDELWLRDGNCLVHLYAPGTSRRGPSLKIPLETIEKSNCHYLFDECLHRPDPSSPSSNSDDDGSDSGYGSISSEESLRYCELYIPAPLELTRQEAFLYHVATRNYFAYLLSKPLVGEHLGGALVSLADRIELWQPDGVSSTSFLDYCQEQGYLDFAENIDYAIAALYLAEKVRIRDIWNDAFAHCVGMQDRLRQSSEAAKLNQGTKDMICRASWDMEQHIAQVTAALGSFLEEELGPESLGLSKPLRDHLDRFRSLLHCYYVNGAGYFPPDKSQPWDKRLWCGMYEDFRSLYEYLADTNSTTDRTSNHGLNGGICVTQNVHAFDERHDYTPLPHPLPLVPDMSVPKKVSDAPKGLRSSFKLGRSDTVAQPRTNARQALAAASNTCNPDVMANRLVQEYIRFERLKLEEKVSLAESRKVRWLLVYGVLQTLISITRAPPEVQDTETPSYPLCVINPPMPSWMAPKMEEHKKDGEPQPRLSAEMEAVRRTMEEDRISIRPDCEADSANDYFSMNSLARSGSDLSGSIASPLRRSSTQMSRTASIRSSVNSIHRSVVGSFSRRNSIRHSSFIAPPKMPSFDELVETYAGDTQEPDNNRPQQDDLDLSSNLGSPAAPAELEAPYVPTLELHQLTGMDSYYPIPDEKFGPGTPDEPAELEGSSQEDLLLPASTSSSNYNSSQPSPATESPLSDSVSPIATYRVQRWDAEDNYSSFEFGFTPKTYVASHSPHCSIHDGCYTPSGSRSPKKTLEPRSMSSESVCSSASSQYPEGSTQAAEIEEEETRGRRRLRALERIPRFRIAAGDVSLPMTPEEH